MTEPAKGMIRWWAKRVMDYSGERHGKWDYGGLEPYTFSDRPWNDPEREAHRQKLVAAQTWVEEPFIDKPYADEFTATMQLEGFYRGRSAAGFTFKDEAGIEHTMRIKCVTDLLKNATLVRGKVTAVWCYTKQGSNFSLKYVRDA
jgi:hypothetical protein